MAKSILRQAIVPASDVRARIADLQNVLLPTGAKDIKIHIKQSSISLKARGLNGENIFEKVYRDDDLLHKESVHCGKMSVEARRKHVARLRKQKHTQAEIAERVGVSQKTVSTDLAAMGLK